MKISTYFAMLKRKKGGMANGCKMRDIGQCYNSSHRNHYRNSAGKIKRSANVGTGKIRGAGTVYRNRCSRWISGGFIAKILCDKAN